MTTTTTPFVTKSPCSATAFVTIDGNKTPKLQSLESFDSSSTTTTTEESSASSTSSIVLQVRQTLKKEQERAQKRIQRLKNRREKVIPFISQRDRKTVPANKYEALLQRVAELEQALEQKTNECVQLEERVVRLTHEEISKHRAEETKREKKAKAVHSFAVLSCGSPSLIPMHKGVTLFQYGWACQEECSSQDLAVSSLVQWSWSSVRRLVFCVTHDLWK